MYYSGTQLEQKAAERCQEQRRGQGQKPWPRGKAPCLVEQRTVATR